MSGNQWMFQSILAKSQRKRVHFELALVFPVTMQTDSPVHQLGFRTAADST